MNVLVLTPDAVGSTLLQRLITIYMQFYDFDKPVINLHELTNGLDKYYSIDFNQQIASKKKVSSWGYYQTLEDIVNLLASVDHYKVSRLAHYHLVSRCDPYSQQIPFYRYLNDNFFIIACRRRNIFEHALSMTLSSITKQLNVYSHEQKIENFFSLYSEPVTVDGQVLTRKLEAYRAYLHWSEQCFNISSYFHYDQHMPDIESYILDLPIFKGKDSKRNWQSQFGISFNDWNKYHHLHSDIGRLSSTDISKLQWLLQGAPLDDVQKLGYYQRQAPAEWPGVHETQDLNRLPAMIKQQFRLMLLKHTLFSMLDTSMDHNVKKFQQRTKDGYEKAQSALKRMQELDIIMTLPPIKKQTFCEKTRIIKNFDQCLDVYNDWAKTNPDVADTLTSDLMQQQIAIEDKFWRHSFDSQCGSLSTEMLGYQNDSRL